VRTTDGHEHEDEHAKPECGCEGILEKFQADAAGRELLGGDTGADDDGGAVMGRSYPNIDNCL
jgi:hypothetical protein